MSKFSKWLNKRKATKAVKNFVRAPDRILHNTTKGDFKKAASIVANPFANEQATRDRFLRREAGAIAGAAGGFIAGGPVGAFAGAAIGGARASKGHGQLKDAAGSFGLGLAAGTAIKYGPELINNLRPTMTPLNPSGAANIPGGSTFLGKVGSIAKTTGSVVSAGSTIAGAITPTPDSTQLPFIMVGGAIDQPVMSDLQGAQRIADRAGDPLFAGAEISSITTQPQPAPGGLGTIALLAAGIYIIQTG